MQIRHFLLTTDGGIREFSAEQAASVAAGANTLPEFAERRVRYLQVTVDDDSGSELRIQTAGAAIEFDGEGKMKQASAPTDEEKISRFEHDAVIQWTLKNIPQVGPTFH